MRNASAKRNRRRNAGFTLVELLIVMTIVGIMMSLMFSGVQAMREAANRTICKNNLAQWGRAVEGHVTIQGWYPTGGWGWNWVGDADRGFDARQPGGWVYNLLPYIGELSLHDTGKFGRIDNTLNDMEEMRKAKAANDLVQSPLPFANCPTRRQAMLFLNSWNHITNNAKPAGLPPPPAVARTDYAFVCGKEKNVALSGGPKDYKSGDRQRATSISSFSGLSFARSAITPAHVLNGTSCMIIIGEKFEYPNSYFTGKDSCDNESMYAGMDDDNWRTTYAPPLRDSNLLTGANFRFGSAHALGCHFVFGDGSVRDISYSVDKEIFTVMGDRNNEGVVDISKLEH
jgi:prepilin-type N-terminal cleavage/methylation domain-containing protein